MKPRKTKLNQESGFGIIEVLIGLAIISCTVALALALMQMKNNALSQSIFDMRFMNLRASILSTLQDDLAWFKTVQQVTNTNLQCLRDQTDCVAVAAPNNTFSLYSATGSPAYTYSATSGFTILGAPCSTFDSVSGNADCPIHLELTWLPICNLGPDPCLNPLTQIIGRFIVNDSSTSKNPPLRTDHLGINFVRAKIYCAPQTLPIAIAVNTGAVNVTGDSVLSTSPALIGYPLGNAFSSTLEACNTSSLSFNYTLVYSGGALASDADNQASVCFFAAGGAGAPCLYEWYQNNQVWKLRSNGADLYTATSTDPMGTAATYKFHIVGGLVSFYYNNERRFVFPNIYVQPLQVNFTPGSTSYSPQGFQNISFTAN